MSLLSRIKGEKLEKRDYGGGVFTTDPDSYNYGLPPGAIPTNGMLGGGGGLGAMSMNRALRNWAVFACIRIIADTISSLPIDLFGPDGEPVPGGDTRLRTPSAYASITQWLWQVMCSTLTIGNAYGLVSATDRMDYPKQIDLISPQGICVEKNDAGLIVLRSGTKVLQPGEFWWLPGPQLPGDLQGLSPIAFAARTINLGLAAQDFSSDFFQNGINPTAVLQTAQTVNSDQASEIKQRVKSAMGQNDIVVLGAGMELNPWQLSAQESQFLETEIHNATAVAQIFGVPPEMLGAATRGSSVTYANREQRAQDFLNNAINPWLVRLEESLSGWFPRGTYVKFNTGALLRSDLVTRYNSYQTGIRNNILLPSEAREFENLPEIPGIDDKLLPGPPSPGVSPGPDDTGTGK